MDGLGHTWIVHGKPVTPYSDEDVYELIRDNVCDDCADYFRERTDVETVLDDLNLTDEDILKNYCSGECDKVQDVQGHYENLLKECGELAREIYNTVIEGWNPGTRRTKKEQFAIDKANQIMNLVSKNT
jgi:hypothetical protein